MSRGASFLLLLNWVCIVSWLISSFDSTTATIIVLATNDTYIDRTAAFGPRIPNEGIVLDLIAIETLDPQEETTACRPLSIAPATNGSWAALVERGGECSFVDKVRNMQASGANAVVVGDNQRSGLITMYAREDASDVLIPSVFIAQHHYRELRYFGNELGKEVLIEITPDDMNWQVLNEEWRYFTCSLALGFEGRPLTEQPLLDIIIFIILTPAFVVFFLYFIWRIRIRQQQIADLAPPEVVTNLPIKVFYTAKLKENDPVECVICLEEFEDETELRVLPCRHEYHVACIDSWLTTRKKLCPICKRDICTATESTPLLRSAISNNAINHHGRRTSRNITPSANIPSASSSTSSLSSPSSSSSGSTSSSAPASSGPGYRIASSWPLRTAGLGLNTRPGPGAVTGASAAAPVRPLHGVTPSSATPLRPRDISNEEQALRRV
ncbi:hypothetical protein EDD11_005775 [Mortierella claussenii]|nr:hypothetical protein EDD11_005775 [Mortierella claussenii]